MVEFFRDKLDGPLYIVVSLFALFLIMAIIGFIMERLRLERDEKAKIAHVGNVVTPINSVKVEENNTPEEHELLEDTTTFVGGLVIEPNMINNNQNQEVPVPNQENLEQISNKQVIVFEDPDAKKE